MRYEHDDEAVLTLGARTPGEIFYHLVAMTEFGVHLLVCNRYAKGISSGPLDRGGLKHSYK